MPKITVSVPDELLKRFKAAFPEVNVAAIARRAISRKVEELKKFEALKTRGVFEPKKFEEFLRELKSKGVI